MEKKEWIWTLFGINVLLVVCNMVVPQTETMALAILGLLEMFFVTAWFVMSIIGITDKKTRTLGIVMTVLSSITLLLYLTSFVLGLIIAVLAGGYL